MSALKILIVEDLFTHAQDLKEQLNSMGFEVIGIAKNSDDAMSLFKNMVPDLALMDIHLKKSKKDGIEIAKEFNKIRKIPIIFITAHSDKEIRNRAKEVEPANYLDKPWHPKQIETVIDFGIENFSRLNGKELNSEKDEGNCFDMGEYFFLKKKNRFIKVHVNNIIYIKAATVCIEIFTEKEKFTFSTNMTNFFRQIQHDSLMRIHKSYAIHVDKFDFFEGNQVIIKIREEEINLPIGPSYREAFKKFFFRLKTD